MFSSNATQVSADKLYADDVFSTHLYTGNGSTLTITNGIDLAGNGGLVWTKCRGTTPTSNRLHDTIRGINSSLKSNTNDASSVFGVFDSVNSNGYTITTANTDFNTSGQTYTSWTFRKAPKFFDVTSFTYSMNVQVAHSIGYVPGVVIIKNITTANDWTVYHTSLGAVGGVTPQMRLNATFGPSSYTWLTALSATSLTFSGLPEGSYVAYIFAHDPSPDGLIQCGSFTTDGSGSASVTALGWEPQFLLVKASSTSGNWIMLDSLRGWSHSTDAPLLANSTAVEGSTEYGNPTATGFNFAGGTASATYVYMAIRRPNKPPTTGGDVLRLTTLAANNGGAVGPTITSAAAGNVDAVIVGYRDTDTKNTLWADRLRGFSSTASTYLTSSGTAVETTASSPVKQVGLAGNPDYLSLATEAARRVVYALKRAPGFFDVTSYSGTDVARTLSHNLNTLPELVIFKSRNTTANWVALFDFQPASYDMAYLNTTAAITINNSYSTAYGLSAAPTASALSIGAHFSDTLGFNEIGTDYVAYLFATIPGISKVGTYTGDGGAQNINCGFSTGARFALIKRTDSTGDWMVFDTARGIGTAGDPRLLPNSTAAETSGVDDIQAYAQGFGVGNAATNTNGATYLYLAIA